MQAVDGAIVYNRIAQPFLQMRWQEWRHGGGIKKNISRSYFNQVEMVWVGFGTSMLKGDLR